MATHNSQNTVEVIKVKFVEGTRRQAMWIGVLSMNCGCFSGNSVEMNCLVAEIMFAARVNPQAGSGHRFIESYAGMRELSERIIFETKICVVFDSEMEMFHV